MWSWSSSGCSSDLYGSGSDRNVGRLLDLAARWPRALPMILPLPGGGRNLVKPILVDDLASAVAAAVRAVDPPRSIVLAGPEPMTYAEMVKACAGAVGRRARVVPAPARAVVGTAEMLSRIGGSAPGAVAGLRRFLEDRSFDIAPARTALGFAPRQIGRAHV